jgi:hypothetical protein
MLSSFRCYITTILCNGMQRTFFHRKKRIQLEQTKSFQFLIIQNISKTSLWKIRYLPHCNPGCIELSLCSITSNSQVLVLSQKCNILKGFSNFNINIPFTIKISDVGTTSQHPTFAHSHRSAYHHSTFYYQQGPQWLT